MASLSSTSLGKWVDQLLNTVFFQADDDASQRAMNQSFSGDLKVRYITFRPDLYATHDTLFSSFFSILYLVLVFNSLF